MADYYNYNNVKIKVNNSGILANSAAFSFSNQLSKTNEINKIGDNEYVADGGVNGTLSLSYYIDANSGDPFNIPDLKPGQKVFSIDVGGLTINSGFLNSYSWSANPHGILAANANFDLYEYFGGTFSPTVLEDKDWDWYKMSDLSITLAGMDVSSKVVSVSFDESHGFEPIYDISGLAPREVRYASKTKSISLETYNITEAIPYTGKKILVDIGIRGKSSTWKTSGTLQSKDLSISFGQKVTSTLSISEDGYGGEPTITLISYPYGHDTLSIIELRGANLDQATAVYFNNGIKANEITERTSTYIKVKIPRFATNGPIRVVTPRGEATIGGAIINSLYIP